ncbi:MAG: hypothetical protein DI536_00735 [Archangium gephyra]|uniref:Uncharacterized protein n=1 Tax=Archangium gephyra TaxID=48 RepID=A0A2W5TRV5_9BACT|nr:MAG: hypothetical protein DI536_00735 [Archangium gephyra]
MRGSALCTTRAGASASGKVIHIEELRSLLWKTIARRAPRFGAHVTHASRNARYWPVLRAGSAPKLTASWVAKSRGQLATSTSSDSFTHRHPRSRSSLLEAVRPSPLPTVDTSYEVVDRREARRQLSHRLARVRFFGSSTRALPLPCAARVHARIR